MRKQVRKVFAALAFATLGPPGCVVGDSPAPEDQTPALDETYLYADACSGAQGTCSGGDDGGGGGGGGGCSNDWDCSPIEECGDSGSCVPLGCG